MVKSSWFSNIYTEAKGKMNRGYTVERELGRHTTGVSVPRVFTGRSGRRVYSTGPSRQWKTPTSFNLPKVRLHSQRRLRHHMAIGTWTTKVIRWVPAKLRTAESWCEYGIYVCCTHSLWVSQRLRTYLVFHLPPLLLLSSETEARVAFALYRYAETRPGFLCTGAQRRWRRSRLAFPNLLPRRCSLAVVLKYCRLYRIIQISPRFEILKYRP